MNDEYFRQLTAEKIVTKFSRGYKKRVFQKIRPRNEALDCFVYAISAYAILNVDINALADKREAQERATPQKENLVQQKQSFVPKTKKSFVNSWR